MLKQNKICIADTFKEYEQKLSLQIMVLQLQAVSVWPKRKGMNELNSQTRSAVRACSNVCGVAFCFSSHLLKET